MKIIFVAFVFSIIISCKKEETGLVIIKNVITSPEGCEMIEITNKSQVPADIEGWTIGDKDNPNAFKISGGITPAIKFEEIFSYSPSFLGIILDTSGEIIYLKDKQGNIIDTWQN